MPWKFSKVNPIELTRFVTPEARDELGLTLNLTDLLSQEGGTLRIVESLYRALLDKNLQYALEKYTPSLAVQLVRTPAEIFRQSEGTCLDLALLFAGLCLAHELLPVLVLLKGHALVAVSMNHGLRQWNARSRKEYETLFMNVLLPKPDAFMELIRSGAYLPVDCTGFAHSKSIPEDLPEGRGRMSDGTMTFERAIEAGREQFEVTAIRAFRCALDVAVAHHFWEMGPSIGISNGLELGRVNSPYPPQQLLPYLCNRSEQEVTLKEAVLLHRATSPRRPLVCVVHGDENECHPEFFDRLGDMTLPQILSHWYPKVVKNVPCTSYTAKLSLERYTPENFRKAVERDFKAATGKDEPIYKQITSHKLCVLVNFVVFSENCSSSTLERLKTFLKYWKELDDLPPDLLFMVCINFRYRNHVRRTKNISYRRWLLKRRNRKIRELAKDLHGMEMSGVTCTALCELQAVDQVDAENLVRHQLVKHFYDLEVGDVHTLYSNEELCVALGHMQMDTLLNNLRVLHNKRQPSTR